MSRVGEKIKNIRINAGISQKQLAKKLGVSESYINEVECGRKVVNQELIDRISKVLGKDINDITMSFEEQTFEESTAVKGRPEKKIKVDKQEEISDIWSGAFASVIRSVPIYDYNMNTVLGTRQMPLLDNKIEGHSQDKVFFLTIQDDDMIGFRIAKGDTAFALLTNEFVNNSISLIQHNEKRMIRQLRKLDNNKALIISNNGTVMTETVEIKEIKIIAKLEKVEIKL